LDTPIGLMLLDEGEQRAFAGVKRRPQLLGQRVIEAAECGLSDDIGLVERP
jgi:hypothetical protein